MVFPWARSVLLHPRVALALLALLAAVGAVALTARVALGRVAALRSAPPAGPAAAAATPDLSVPGPGRAPALSRAHSYTHFNRALTVVGGLVVGGYK